MTTGRGRVVVQVKSTAQYATVTQNVEMSGCGDWWVESMKMLSLGDSACTRIGSQGHSGAQFN